MMMMMMMMMLCYINVRSKAGSYAILVYPTTKNKKGRKITKNEKSLSSVKFGSVIVQEASPVGASRPWWKKLWKM